MITATSSSSGHCLCRNVHYRFEGPRTWACFCHCEDCRRNCAAPIVAYIGVPLDGFRWQVREQEGTEPEFYPSSQGVKRFFRNQCGTPMAFQAEHYPGEIHLYAATLENPQDFKPTFHVHYREKLSWLHLDDSLQRYPRSAPADPVSTFVSVSPRSIASRIAQARYNSSRDLRLVRGNACIAT